MNFNETKKSTNDSHVHHLNWVVSLDGPFADEFHEIRKSVSDLLPVQIAHQVRTNLFRLEAGRLTRKVFGPDRSEGRRYRFVPRGVG
jgi:hypothetical protein